MKNTENNLRKFRIECSCHSPEHEIELAYDVRERDMTISFFLTPHVGFFGRFWLALKYLFGSRPLYGHFDSIYLIEEELDDTIDKFKKVVEIHANNTRP